MNFRVAGFGVDSVSMNMAGGPCAGLVSEPMWSVFPRDATAPAAAAHRNKITVGFVIAGNQRIGYFFKLTIANFFAYFFGS